MISRIGQSYTFTIKSRDVQKYGPRSGCPRCKYITGEVATPSGHSKECKIRIMVERAQDENKHCVRKWYVAKGIDQREHSFKSHEGKAGKGGTPEKNKGQEQPAQTCICLTPAAATWQCEELRRDIVTNRVLKEPKGPRQAVTTATRCAAQ